MSNTIETSEVRTQNELMPIEDIDYVEVYVGNAKQAAFFYSKLFGLDLIAFRGLETGVRDRCSYLLGRGEIRFVISGAYQPDHEITKFVSLHGDGIKDIAFRVDDVEQAYQYAIANGGVSISEPYEETDELGTIRKAVIGTFGDTVHTLIQRDAYQGTFLPGFVALDVKANGEDTKLTRFDHIAVNVEDAERWTEYYRQVFGFRMLNDFTSEEISSENSSLMTKALQNGTERVKFTVVAPAAGKKKSQLQEFIDYNQGPGVHHIALLTDDILTSVENLRANGLSFLYTPDEYYEIIKDRVGEIDEAIEDLNRLHILVDRDSDGYLLQIFAASMHDRPTMFYEIIQRKGSLGFGNRNIRALFEAAEREQARRGNL
ncbi:MAG: 4-hydroxyphenylpyruvate dioxygenase [Tumebacillaceae bacterium]